MGCVGEEGEASGENAADYFGDEGQASYGDRKDEFPAPRFFVIFASIM
jgi:hypothetical protein